jgi:hypothetical protein
MKNNNKKSFLNTFDGLVAIFVLIFNISILKINIYIIISINLLLYVIFFLKNKNIFSFYFFIYRLNIFKAAGFIIVLFLIKNDNINSLSYCMESSAETIINYNKYYLDKNYHFIFDKSRCIFTEQIPILSNNDQIPTVNTDYFINNRVGKYSFLSPYKIENFPKFSYGVSSYTIGSGYLNENGQIFFYSNSEFFLNNDQADLITFQINCEDFKIIDGNSSEKINLHINKANLALSTIINLKKNCCDIFLNNNEQFFNLINLKTSIKESIYCLNELLIVNDSQNIYSGNIELLIKNLKSLEILIIELNDNDLLDKKLLNEIIYKKFFKKIDRTLIDYKKNIYLCTAYGLS